MLGIPQLVSHRHSIIPPFESHQRILGSLVLFIEVSDIGGQFAGDMVRTVWIILKSVDVLGTRIGGPSILG